MKIEGALLRAQPIGVGGPEVGRVLLPRVFHSPGDEPFATREVPSQQPMLWRGGLSSLRQQALQNAPTARVNTAPPGPNSTDSQLAGELEKHFGELHGFLKEGRLTQASLRQIAAQTLSGE
ncbi:hypothetical protein [Pseudomonas salomonii]|jgi:hypothetical protein|uniref:Uncharacterized protein n=1 Tax=Pseudomonas salomonii TaxID=191391 RepID=A0ABS9GN11_9PSED|nr:hypothetical protein [Pseudomonas salomonii]MCF5546965.1 hypothetical protein [Pseudomonas salomonii]